MYETLVRSTDAPPLNARSTGHGVQASGLGKRFGDLWALRGLDLDVRPGTVLGLLGHNGAGKTTAIRILTTLSVPTEGSATVAGFDVGRQGADVRRRIGAASQQATVDGLLDGRLNLEMVGRLHGLPKAHARRRADELLERFQLAEAGKRLAKDYSGGMRRRLDLAACLVAHPDVLFLDEPTTGLDPRAREDLWQMLRELIADGTTLILTTQYLEEADRLADDIVVLDHGRTVAHGTPAELKARIGDTHFDVILPGADQLGPAAEVLGRFARGPVETDAEALTVSVATDGSAGVVDVIRAFDTAGVEVVDINRRLATLDDVFLTLTSEKS